MSTTRQDLRNLIRRRLGDTASPYDFSDLQINQWINDAISDLSIHFPRTLNTTINCSASVRSYELPAAFRGVVSVEYPAGEDPPRYLYRMPHTDDVFYSIDTAYDIVKRYDQTDLSELWISALPAAGEDIVVYYLADHASLDDDTDLFTTPYNLLELVVLFVRWTAYQELAMTESANPDPTNLAMGTLELNAYRAKREYRIKLEDYKRAMADSATARWRMDKWDRAY